MPTQRKWGVKKMNERPEMISFCQTVVDNLKAMNVVFLLGPKLCGKTECLKQMEQLMPGVKYIDFKEANKNEAEGEGKEILRSIEANEPVLYLLDHIEYADKPKRLLCEMYQALSWNMVCNGYEKCKAGTHAVVSGNTCAAVEHWAHFAFGGSYCKMIYMDFSNNKYMSEWMYFSIEEYMKEYLFETELANSKSGDVPVQIIPKCDRLDVHILMDILSGCPDRLLRWDGEALRQGFLFLLYAKLILVSVIQKEKECIKSLELDLLWNHKWFDLKKDYNIKYTYRTKYSWLCEGNRGLQGNS